MTHPPVKALLKLLGTGQCGSESHLDTLLPGLAHPMDDGHGWTISKRLLWVVKRQLTNAEEAVAALLATQAEIRQPWLAIIASRAKEAGKLGNPEALVQLVSRLGAAAKYVEQTLPGASLKPTAFSELERQLLGGAAEQSQTLPALTRVLATAAELIRWQQADLVLPSLVKVDGSGEHPEKNWCRGRLLALPQPGAQPPQSSHSTLLPGNYSLALDGNPEQAQHEDKLAAVTRSPWLFLLTSITYAQDSWAAEQRGGLLLELPTGQSPSHPNGIQVLVEDHDGNEVLCGTMGELVLRVLDALDMALFPATPSVNELDSLLAPVIHQLIAHKLWQYHDGLSGEQGFYRMAPTFADECYRIAGSRILGRRARHLWYAVRTQAELWRQEKQNTRQSEQPRQHHHWLGEPEGVTP